MAYELPTTPMGVQYDTQPVVNRPTVGSARLELRSGSLMAKQDTAQGDMHVHSQFCAATRALTLFAVLKLAESPRQPSSNGAQPEDAFCANTVRDAVRPNSASGGLAHVWPKMQLSVVIG